MVKNFEKYLLQCLLFCGEAQNFKMGISETFFAKFLPIRVFSLRRNQKATIIGISSQLYTLMLVFLRALGKFPPVLFVIFRIWKPRSEHFLWTSFCVHFIILLKLVFVFKTPHSLEPLRFVYFKVDKFARNEQHLYSYFSQF